MATRVDFYVMGVDKQLEFIGSTVNEYYGDFETATNKKDYLKSVRELLKENNSIEGKWYWPWKNSHISDQVFVFKITPSWFNKEKGVLMTKVHVKGCEETHLNLINYDLRGDDKYQDEDGYYIESVTEKHLLPLMK